MKKIKLRSSIAAIMPVVFVYFAMLTPAHAYIDPGMGSIILQGIIGAIAAFGAFWYTLRERIRSFFSPAPDKPDEPENSKQD